MMPGFFQWLHPLLPFTYGINLLRETVGGMYSFNYLFNLCILGVFLIVALFIGLQLRPLLLNLNLLFDKQLSTTGMMICESNDLPRQRYSLRTAMRVMLDSDSYRRELLDHAVAFEHRYPYYIKGGFAAVVGVQVLLFVLSTVLDIDNNGKIILLVIWIISVIAICGWLINIEYIRASLNTQMRISRFRMRTCVARCANTRPPFLPPATCLVSTPASVAPREANSLRAVCRISVRIVRLKMPTALTT